MTADLFNPDWYWRHNPDVAAAVEAGLLDARNHFETFGRYEGRPPGPGFNPDYYLAQNPDIAAAVEAGLMTAYDHFLLFGIAEGRSFLAHFDAVFYTQRNPDIGAAIQQGLTTAIDHFLQFGMHEQRVLNPFFDMDAYLRANPDVAAAVEQGLITPLDHLMRFGLVEGRDLGNGISLAQFMNDPVFVQALSVEGGNTFDALARVNAVAPFFREFEPPEGWVPAPDTPIPVDFVPLSGVKLVVPPSVVVPDGMILPDTFEPMPGPVPPEPPVPPTPPVPPVPDDGGGGGPVTVHHLYDGDSVVAQPHDQRFVIHIDAAKENVIKIGEYLEHQVIDLSQVPGLQVYSDAKERLLEVRQAEYDGTEWLSDSSTPPYAGDSMALWLRDHFHLQLTDKFGETARFHVGANANSFGYQTVRVNGAPVDPDEPDSAAGIIIGAGHELLMGGKGSQALALAGGDMAVGGADTDLFILENEATTPTAIIGDYDFDGALEEFDLIVPLFTANEMSLVSPFELTVQKSANHLVPAQGLVAVGGGQQTDLEVVYGGKVLLHIADLDNKLDGAASKSVGFLLADGVFAVHNVWDGGVIDTTDAWADIVTPPGDGCGCGGAVLEYLIGGDGTQTITGGEALFGVLAGGAGDDTLHSNAVLAVYMGGSGNDTINLGDEGFGWVRFEASAAENGVDTIRGFKAGDVVDGGNYLDFSAFLWGLELSDVLDGSGTDLPELGDTGGGGGGGGGADSGQIVVKDFGRAGLVASDFDLLAGEKAVGINLHDDTVWFADGGTSVVKVAELVEVTGALQEHDFDIPAFGV